jgi:hypothetical protein
MLAVQQMSMTVLAHRWPAPVLVAFTIVAGAVVYGLILYLLDKRALQKGFSTLRHLRPQEASI